MCVMICDGCGRWGTLSTFRICSCGLRMRRYEEAPVRALTKPPLHLTHPLTKPLTKALPLTKPLSAEAPVRVRISNGRVLSLVHLKERGAVAEAEEETHVSIRQHTSADEESESSLVIYPARHHVTPQTQATPKFSCFF